MKSISPTLQAHLDGELTTLAYLVKITRADGAVKGFTTHDSNLIVDGVTYKADGAFTPSALQSSSGLATDNLEVTGILNSGDLEDSDIEAGYYDQARVDIYVCNWADVTQGVMQLRRGWLGEVALSGGHYVAEMRGLHDLLQRPIGAYYTPECRYDLGDSRCAVNIAALTVTGSVTLVADNANFTDSSRSESNDVFNYGKLTWTSGANNGLSMEVKDWNGSAKNFTLWLPMPNAVQIGDGYAVYPGCDKRFSTCRDTFSNAANFGGFPYVPGVGNILKYPNSH
ncbi:MAG: DUF2163 domain-containing protein [Alphaproteobacteria bacterium]|nr:DUF2163 domain-containing protein [Alphaproteobacteria bacterium]